MTASQPQVLAILPGLVPSTIIYIVKPLIGLHRSGQITAKITLESVASQHDLEWANLVVFCRNTKPKYAHLLDFIQNRKIPFTYDLDDNFFEIPLDSDIGKYHRNPDRLAMLSRYMEAATLLRVYSEPLLEKGRTLNPKVEKIFGPIDLSLIFSSRYSSNPGRIKIVFPTSRVQDKLSLIFTPALIRILDTYTGKVEIHFWGFIPPVFKGRPAVYYHPWVRQYDRFIRRLSQTGYDIGLAPLLDDIFHRSKTNVKFREYGACRIAGIYSNVDVYSTCITHQETGLLVPNDPEAWYQAMVRLIEDTDLRERIKGHAQEYVRHHYSQENFEKIWFNHIQKVLAEKNRSSSPFRPAGRQETNILFPAEYPIRLRLTHLAGKVSKLIRSFIEEGPSATFGMLRSYFYIHWVILQLRFLTSSTYNIFNHLRH